AALGVVATGVAAVGVGVGPDRATFCALRPVGESVPCSYVAGGTAAVVATLFCVLTLGVLALSVPALRRGLPSGEYVFLLMCSLTGGVVLGYANDLVTLIVALETLTLPLYALVGLRRGVLASITGAVNFFVVSVVSTAVTLMGAALLYTTTGSVYLAELSPDAVSPAELPLVSTAAVLVLAGLAFKVAAVPFHAWAPGTYDGAPLPVAAYLSTASKLGGVIALLYVALGLAGWWDLVGYTLAGLAVLTMTVGNLVALRQTRMVRLLAWSSVAQSGYILAPLGALAWERTGDELATAITATLAYTVFYVLLELVAFGSLIGMRGAADGGPIEAYRGMATRAPWLAAALALALTGLAGLPPGLAGLFAKVAVVRALLDTGTGWLALVVALNAVVGLAYYVRVAALLYRPPAEVPEPVPRVVWQVAAAVAVIALLAVIVGFAPQLVLDVADVAVAF
ncbi:MAG: NADH-quinone oxidoreductase subunit N, partial [Micromonosporaceae bacterium]